MTLSPDQLLARRSSIGSSDIAAVLGLSSYAGPHDVWAQKVGESEPFEGNEFTEFGERLEPVLLDWWEQRQTEEGHLVRHCPQWAHDSEPWMTATPDSLWIPYDKPSHTHRIVEAKTANWRMADQWGEPGTDQIPIEYLCQVQWQMAVLNVDRADIVVLLDREFRVYTVHRRIDIEEAMIAQAREFWGYVERKELPPIDGSEACFHALARRNRGGEYLTGVEEIEHLYEMLAERRAAMAGLEADEKRLSAQIMAKVGPEYKGYKSPLGTIQWIKKKGARKIDYKSVAIARGATKEEIDAATTFGAPIQYVEVRVKGDK